MAEADARVNRKTGELARHVSLTAADLDALREAVRRLEHVSLAARLNTLVGKQVSLAARMLPASAGKAVAAATQAALRVGLKVALLNFENRPQEASRMLHKALAAASGAVGGAFGAATLAFELPVSTTIMLRSIADIARSEGEDLRQPDAALACLQVLALGGVSDETLEGGYFALRGLMTKSVADAATYIAQKGVADQTAPALVRFIADIAARFGVVVGEKVAAQAVPVIGAVGGAVVNYAFVDHFQSLARGHFIVRRLERIYGPPLVRMEYLRLRAEAAAPT